MNIVKELRKKAGIQQKELAIAIGVSSPTVSDWENQKKDPSGPRLKKLAEFFGVDELVILGKTLVDSPDLLVGTPKTLEARIVSGGMDQLPQEDREQILSVIRAMYSKRPELFNIGGSDDA